MIAGANTLTHYPGIVMSKIDSCIEVNHTDTM